MTLQITGAFCRPSAFALLGSDIIYNYWTNFTVLPRDSQVLFAVFPRDSQILIEQET